MGTAITDRYDRVARGYRQCWGPVLHPGGARLLARVERAIPDLTAARSVRVLDVGCGTGNQLLLAAARWPAALATGLDASEGMLAVAREEADMLPPAVRERIEFVHADAAKLPFADASFDLVLSSFVLQLVPDRAPVLAEMHRVLRPGGLAGLATWLEDRAELDWQPDVLFDDCLAELGIDRPERDEVRAGDFHSVRAAASEIRAAGFRHVAARADALDHAWTPESYATYKRVSRERDLFDSLTPDLAGRLEAAFRARLDRLYAAEPEAFRFRPPFATVLAVRP